MTPSEEAQLVGLALNAIGQIWEAVQKARAGHIDASEVLSHVSTLHDALQANNAAADRELAERFPQP
jgi:hypothetical protein